MYVQIVHLCKNTVYKTKQNEYWVESLEGGDCTLLSATRRMVMEKMAENGIGKVRSPQEEMHIVPKGVGTKKR
jgi:hypothetical protein